jgi:LysM repeat protein
MAAETLRERLRKYFVQPDRFALPASNDLGSKDVDALISAYLPEQDGAATLLVTDCRDVEGEERVTWKGRATLSRGQKAPYDVDVVFYLAETDGAVQLTVATKALPEGWTLADSFPALAGSAVADAPGGSPQLALSSAPTQSPAYEKGLSYGAGALGEGVLAHVAWLIPDLTDLRYAGVVELKDAGEQLDLPVFRFAIGPGDGIQLGPLHLAVRLALVAETTKVEYVDGGSDVVWNAYVELGTSVRLGASTAGDPVSVTVVTRLFWSDEESLLSFSLADGPEATLDSYDQLDSLAGGTHRFGALIPGDLGLPTARLSVTALDFTIDTRNRRLTDVAVSVLLQTESPWPILPGGLLKIESVGAAFTVTNPMASPDVSARLFGRFQIAENFSYDVTVLLPQVELSGELAPDSEIDVSKLVNFFARPLVGEVADIQTGLSVRQLDFWAAPRQSSFTFAATVLNDWRLELPLFTLAVPTVSADVSYGDNAFAVVFSTSLLLDDAQFDVSATHEKDAGWVFTLEMPPGSKLELFPILRRFFNVSPWSPPDTDGASLAIQDVFVQVDSKTGAYEVRGEAVLFWDLDLLGETLKARAYLKVKRTPGKSLLPRAAGRLLLPAEAETAEATTATFGGELALGRFQVAVEYQYVTRDQTTLTFTFRFDAFELTAVLTEGEDKKTGEKQRLLTASLGDLSLGRIIESLVALVDPNLHFQLEPPWDFLNEINLKNLQLKVNLTTKAVEIAYKVDREFVIAYLDTIGLSYAPRSDGKRSVNIAITGRFLDQTYDDANPLGWDLLNEPAPTPPGKGSTLLDVRYLGLGQNVGFRKPRSFTSVRSVIEALESDFKEVPEGGNPLDSLAPLKFTGDGRWLIGADLTVMETVSLSGVFADPELYGIRIGLAGERAKALAGLEFEILYRKVTDTIGVYQIELKLPNALRQLEFGALSITLPVIYVEIYTNGNFRVDLGFPRGGDFSRSFSLQFFPFVGFGGFYFALLNGATSTRVPRITNGAFSPVIEFGVGLKVGLGKTVDKGVLKAGATLTVQAIIEGVIGWFNPTDRSAPKAEYFWIQGTAAVAGELYGVVDFVVIKAEVHVLARATAQLTIEAYKPTIVALELHVEASASVTILFIRVHFSFEITLDLSFTIGEERQTPWLVDRTAPPPAGLLRQARGRYRPRAHSAAGLLRALRAAAPADEWNWTPGNVFAERRRLLLSVMPSLTAALRDGAPEVEVVMALWVPGSIPAAARTAREAAQVRMAAPEEAPFNALLDGVLRWALRALVRDDRASITAAELDAIGTYLSDPSQQRAAYTYDHLRTFLGKNYEVAIGTPLGPTGVRLLAAHGERWGRWSKWAGGAHVPSVSDVLGERGPAGLVGFTREAGGAAALRHDAAALAALGATGPEDSGTVFPMVPELVMTPDGRTPVDFSTHQQVSPKYQRLLDETFAALRIDATEDVARDPLRREDDPPSAAGASEESLATFIFRDYFALLGKGVVEQAAQLLRRYPHRPGPYDTLESIAESYDPAHFVYRTRAGDTVARVAATFGTTPEVLVERNPGLAGRAVDAALPQVELSVSIGVTPQSILAANQEHPLAATGMPPPVLVLDHVKYQVKNADTLAKIAAGFGMTGPAPLFETPGLGNDASTSLFRTGARLTVPQGPHFVARADDVTAGDPLPRAAAFYTVRQGPAPETGRYPYLPWYVQQIADLNRSDAEVDVADLGRSVGRSILVPRAKLTAQGPSLDGTTRWTVRPADTVDRVAACFELVQLDPQVFAPLLAQLTAQNPGPIKPDQALRVPALERVVQPSDSLERIRSLFGATYGELLGPTAGNATRPGLLNPLNVLDLPRLHHHIQAGDTPVGVAQRFDLTLDALATSIAGCTGIFPVKGDPLLIPDVPKRSIDQLVADLLANGRFHSVAAMASRFLLHGLRVPEPTGTPPADARTGPAGLADRRFQGLYELVGQQWKAPVVAPTGGYPVRFTKGDTASWFEFASPVEQALDVVLTSQVLHDERPEPVLDPQVLTGPTAAPLFIDTAPRYGLEQSLHWQAAAPPQMPAGPTGATGPAAGQPSLWLLPGTLTSLLAGVTGPTGTTRPYEIVEAAPRPDDPLAVRPLERYAWGTAVPLQVRRAPDGAGGVLSNAYLVLGADSGNRDILRQLWEHLEASHDGARLYFLYRPPADASSTSGLASDALDSTATVLFRTNLSTVTSSGPQALSAGLLTLPTAGEFYARLGAPAAFLKYLWEGSITGSGGFYLRYADTAQNGLPDALFANGPETTLWLVALLDSQNGTRGRDRALHAFTNCAAIGDNVGLGGSPLSARLEHPLPEDLVAMATAPAGVVGFRLTRLNPDFGATGLPDPQQRTRSLFNLVGYRVEGNDYFRPSPEGLPAGPRPLEGAPTRGRDALRAGATADPRVWTYEQLVPVARFGGFNAAVACTALPPPAENPYAGITGPTGPAPLSYATLSLEFQDVYGNRTQSTHPLGTVQAPAGYTDPLLGVGAWPGAAAGYAFTEGPPRGATAGVRLHTLLSLQTDRYAPGAGIGVDGAVRAASADALRYRQIYFQTQQPDVHFSLRTNVASAPPGAGPLQRRLAGFAAGAFAYVSSASRVLPVGATASAGDTLASVARAHSVPAGALLAANQDQRARRVFATAVAVPFVRAARPGDSLESLAAIGGTASAPGASCPSLPVEEGPQEARAHGVRLAPRGTAGPVGLPRVAAVDAPPLTPADVARANVSLPLASGPTLLVPERSFETAGLTGAAASLSAIAARLGCNVYDAFERPPAGPTGPSSTVLLGIVGRNFTATGLVAPDVLVAVGDQRVATDGDSTFESLYRGFTGVAIGVGEFAQQIRDVPGLVRESATLRYADLVLGPGALGATGPVTLGLLERTFPGALDDIARDNRRVGSLFEGGAPVFLNATCVTPDATESLFELSHVHGVTVDQLADSNVQTPLRDLAVLEIPDLLALPAHDAALYAPYTTAAGESIHDVARRFGHDARTLARLAAGLRDLLRAGTEVTYPGLAPVQTDARSTIQSVYDAFQAQDGALSFDAFAEALAPQDVLRPEGGLFMPLPAVPADPALSPSLDALAASLQLRVAVPGEAGAPDVAALAGANRALDGFLREGATVRGPAGASSETVGPHDTFTSVAARFAARGASVSPAELAVLNRGDAGLLAVGARFLVPPSAVAVATDLDAVVPPRGATGEAAVLFPIETDLILERERALVSPSFRDTAAVSRAVTPLAPWSGAGGALGLTDFARLFEDAFRPFALKVATSKAREVAAEGAAALRAWAVDLGASGVRGVTLQQDAPQFYAIRPVSTSLVSRDGVPVSSYRSGVGLCCPKQPKSFASVDLDGWLSQLLSTIDLALTPAYTVAAFVHGSTGPAAPRVAAAAAGSAGPLGLVGREGAGSPLLFAPAATGGTAAPCFPCPGATAVSGPSDYETLVQAKEDLANGLAGLVESVLEPGPAVPYHADQAREAMRQQMLVRLGDAYAYDVVVQYPVAVESPFTDSEGRLTAPRLAGQIQAVPYVTPPDATLAAMAGDLGASVAFTCAVLLDTRSLLQPGARVEYGHDRPAYEVGPGDTLRSLADYFGVAVDVAEEAAWPAWREFTAALAALAGLVASDTGIALSRARRMAYPRDTLEMLAAYFNTAVGSLGHAAETVPGLFRVGARLDVAPGVTFEVKKAGLTLLEVLAAIQTETGRSLDVATLCARNRHADVLAPFLTFGWAQVQPDFSVTTAKIGLANVALRSGATVPPPLTFLARVKRDRRYRKVFLNLRFAAGEVEHDIRDVAGVTGYQASSWLTFVIPPESPDDRVRPHLRTAIEQVSVPLPLRSYPTPPSLVAQTGTASVPGAADVRDARLWDYGFTYESRNADQDTDYLEVAFGNRRYSPAFLGAGASPLAQRLFPPLAQFAEVAAPLQADLAQLPRVGRGGDAAAGAVAFHVLAGIAAEVANAFRLVAAAAVSGTVPRQVYTLRTDATTDVTGSKLDALTLFQVGYTGPAGGQLGGTGVNGGWPEVAVWMPDGPTGAFRPLVLQHQDTKAASYAYDPPVDADAALTQRLVFGERDVIQNEDGWAGVYVTRNADLVSRGPLGPTGSAGGTGPIATSGSFVYRTPPVRFVDKLTPLLVDQTRIPIEDVRGGAARRPLEAYLNDLVETLLDLGPTAPTTGDYTVKVSCNYLYPLAGSGADELLAATPVLLHPGVLLTRANHDAFVVALAGALRAWVRDNAIDTTVGRLQVQVTVFSSEGEARTAALRAAGATGPVSQPILDLQNLQLEVAHVDWKAPPDPSGPKGLA